MEIRKLETKYQPEFEMIVPHGSRELTFLAPYFGRNNYSNLRTQVAQAGLRMPIYAENSSLAYDSFMPQSEVSAKFANQVRDIMKSSRLISNTFGHVTKEGLYVVDSPSEDILVNGWPVFNEKDLTDRLGRNDPLVRFVQRDKILIGYIGASKLSDNQVLIALGGGAGNGGELCAQQHTYMAKRHATKEGWISDRFKQKGNTIVARLGSYWDGGGLDVGGRSLDDSGGYVFGVSESSEAGAQRCECEIK